MAMDVSENSEDTGQENWSSRTTFLLAAVGGAVGLGNLWRFPYVTGENGGGAFVLVYLGFVFLICMPIMLGEFVLGRQGSGSAIDTMRRLVVQARASRFWNAIGWISVIIPFVGLSYYAVVAGWALDYLWLAVSNAFSGISPEDSGSAFGVRTSNVGRQLALHAGFILVTVGFVMFGVKRGIEVACKIMMPGLFVILIGIVIYNALFSEFGEALKFLFQPDFSKLTFQATMEALGQAFFSLAIGTGMMFTYVAYLPKNVSLPQCARVICISDTLVALFAGLAIFPIVFQYGLTPGEGPGLIFVTLPVAFGQMEAGLIVGTLFFLLLCFAAFSTSLGMLEPVVAWLKGMPGFNRPRATVAGGFAAWLAGVGSVFSFNIWSDFHPLGWVGLKNTYFEIIDFFIANLLLPINGLLIALFAGWIITKAKASDELQPMGKAAFSYWHFVCKYLAPIAIIAVLGRILWKSVG